jgi:hypothetical protein
MEESSDEADESGSDGSEQESEAEQDEQMEDDDTEGESEYYEDDLGEVKSRIPIPIHQGYSETSVVSKALN